MTDELPDCLCGHPIADHLRDLGNACKRGACGCRFYRLPTDGQTDLFAEEAS